MKLDNFLDKLCTFENPDNLLIFINESLERKDIILTPQQIIICLATVCVANKLEANMVKKQLEIAENYIMKGK